MSFDLAGALRRLKPHRATGVLAARPDSQLMFLASRPGGGPELLLDTTVYIDVLQGRSPPELDELLTVRIINHSSVALAELTHLFGKLNPTHPKTKAVLREVAGVIADIPTHRLERPSARAAGEAGILAGMVARLTGRQSGVGLLNDAQIFLQAMESGRVLVTANVEDFDLMQQIVPSARVAFYRKA